MTQVQVPPPTPRRRRKQLPRWARDVALVVTTISAIAYAATIVKPVYAGRAPIVGDMIRQVSNQPDVAPAPATGPLPAGPAADSARIIEASPEFAEQKRRFAADLVATGRMSQARADSIAHFAVREAFLRGVPPAVIFGVMLTENARFISGALSNVGAVGLMQVYPKIWLKKQFSDSLGTDLASDSTNVRYGVFILSQYFNPRTRSGEVRSRDYRTALLRYNGCVKGSNTPNCKTYPDKVRRYVEASATSICDGRGFFDCIAKPFVEGLLGEPPSSTQ